MTTKKPTKTPAERYVLVATKTRRWTVATGVFVRKTGDTVELRDARMIAYYSADAHALFGVAARGPGAMGRVSPAVERAEVRGVELVLDCTPAARKAIEAAPWH